MISEELERYIIQYSSPQSDVLKALERRTYLSTLFPRMLSGHIQGKFLEMLSFMLAPQYILEIGTFTGYSAICLAQGLVPEGKLISIEANRELRSTALEAFVKAGMADKIELIIGRAEHEIPALNKVFDLVFIDADKENYCLYFDLVFDKVRKGGFILADNVLWSQKVLNPSNRDAETSGIVAFNKKVAADDRVEQLILPLRDGITLIRKK
ncbi:MAG: class I SAM-dependent methyltransferase [Bacteroidales bacterium]|nr:class I SAM-dependent methyltransferase [Bacteroidales bacterium]